MPALRRFAAAVALSLLACSSASGPPRARVWDLVALLPLAETESEVATIDVGSPAAREHLASGWYSNQKGTDGSTSVWSRGEISVLEFFLAAPRDLRVEIRCAPLSPSAPEAGGAGDGGPQVVRTAVNGRWRKDLILAPGMHAYAVDLPRADLHAGINRLIFSYRYVSEPRRENGHRRLAVEWDALRFLPAGAAGAEPAGEPGALFLPFGSEVSYFLDLPGAAELALDRIETRGAAAGRLDVAAEVEGGPPMARTLAAGSSAHALELPGRRAHLLHLVLRAVGSPADAAGGLLLAAPTVRATASPARLARPAARDGNAAAPQLAAPRPGAPPPNIVVYLVDTLRADRLGCYGSAKPTSAALDGFARGAVLFEHAFAQSSWTRPTVTTLMTGLGPLAHGVTTLEDKLPAAATTLAERLQAAGYRTAGFSTNPQVSVGTGLSQGFANFTLFPGGTRSAAVNPPALRWLDAGRGRSPFFLYIQTIDPHVPYAPAPELARRFAPGVPVDTGTAQGADRVFRARGEERERLVGQLSALYDAEVAGNVESFGELVAALRARRLFDSTLIVFVADHGEEFDEHGALGHGFNLYGETLHVPLVVKWPGETRGARVRRLVQQIDLVPTILRAAGIAVPPGLPGSDLRSLAAASPASDRPVLSHLSYGGREGVSLIDGGWKVIVPLTPMFGGGAELYRLDDDAAERVDRSERDPVRAGYLRARVRRELLLAHPKPAAERTPIDGETRKALAALGYL